MKINNFSLVKTKKEITLSADVAFSGSKAELMYFETDIKNKSLISADYSPFLAAVLLPCMKTGENIEIDGHVSKKLLQNTRKIMELVESWDVGLKKINVIARNEMTKQSQLKNLHAGKTGIAASSATPRNDKTRVGVFFSTGVDSFYTYLKNKKEITDLIFVHGFDIPLSNKLLFKKVKNINSQIAKEENINLVTITTNVAEIVEKRLIWDFAHGGALASVALFLGSGFKEVFISGAVKKDMLFPYGTHPDLDKYWSTENTSVVHFGTEYDRLEKVMNVVSKSPTALAYLHVCTQNIKGKYNCSKCFKCLTTMIELACANVLEKQHAFDKKIDLESVRSMYYDYSLLYNVQGEAHLAQLKKQNIYPDLQNAIQISLEKSKKPNIIKKFIKLTASFDQKYNDRRIYRAIFAMNKNQDRNIFFKFLLKKGVFK